jgi:pimeloyl-ACP methyl ester carboxylesterase
MGLGRESAHWGEVPALLEQTFPESRALCVDLPGTGARWKGVAPTTASATVEILRQDAVKKGFRSELDPNRKWIMVGISLGAMVGWEWLSMFSDDFAGAICVNMSLPRVNPQFQRLTPYALRKSLRFSLARSTVEKERAILELVSNSAEVRMRLLPEWLNIQQARPVSTANILRQLQVAQSIGIPDDSPHENILLMVSEKDRMVSAKCSYAIQSRWQLPLVSHPWAGHGLNGDDPQWFVRQVQAWMNAQPNV